MSTGAVGHELGAPLADSTSPLQEAPLMQAVMWHGIGDPIDAVIRVSTAATWGTRNDPHRAS